MCGLCRTETLDYHSREKYRKVNVAVHGTPRCIRDNIDFDRFSGVGKQGTKIFRSPFLSSGQTERKRERERQRQHSGDSFSTADRGGICRED
ncbi:hypothetical protein KFK09_007132 [Dendrobium nobile]|uniref:Uncharacterized protein n=1 Tax=Dendrobium nobile TaxID=94219 RepID=A0A8T3BVI2_DENNO|nr:hypothetical protein KFK09_007132 [Dendrobium nobile]